MKHWKRFKRAIIIAILIYIVYLWHDARKNYSIECISYNGPEVESYTENQGVLDAMSLSYLVYGCEQADNLSGTVKQIVDNNKMGILIENAGIKRKEESNADSAVINTTEFINKYVGDYRFIKDLKDEKTGFYGAAFCDDKAKCVWISYSGTVTLRDTLSCFELILMPGLSKQEKLAIKLYEEVLASEEVCNKHYGVILTGHSLGGAYATLVSAASGCRAITVNGADGIAVDKFKAIEEKKELIGKVSNYMTSPKDEKTSFLGFVQRLMFLGSYKSVDYHIFEANQYTTDPHGIFSFIEFDTSELIDALLPDDIKITK